MTLREPPIRSAKYLRGSKGASCKLQIPDVCTGDVETVIPAHIRDRHTGRGQKASDLSTTDACWACHEVFDRRAKLPSGEYLSDLDWYVYALRGLQDTIEKPRTPADHHRTARCRAHVARQADPGPQAEVRAHPHPPPQALVAFAVYSLKKEREAVSDPFAYINSYCGLNIRRGQRVEYSGGDVPRMGTVTGADGAHVLIKLDGGKASQPYHPTWKLNFSPGISSAA